MKKDNPFTLMFGKAPKACISRVGLENDIIDGFTADQPLYQTYLVSGVRGSGKTVLMSNVAERLKESGEWIVVDLNINQHLLGEFANRLTDACRLMPNFFEKGFDISLFGVGIGVGGTSVDRDSTSILERLLLNIKKKNKKVLILIDEVVNTKEMKVFASQFQIFAKTYPIFLIMTGLYENIYSIQNDPALTFLLRSPKVFLEPLSTRQISLSYQKLLSVSPINADDFARLIKGYAFAFQAFGLLYYEYSDTLSINEIVEKLDDLLDDYVYKKIWGTLSEKERQIVLAIPFDNEIKTGDLCTKLKMTNSSFSQYRERLLRKGIITSNRYGFLEFSLPRFGQIIKYYI